MMDLFEQNTLTGRTTKDDVKVGVPFYTVHALGEQSYLTELTPIEKPCISQHSASLFVECEGQYGIRSHSLSDMGIIPNTYNDHQTFNDLESAEAYLALAKNMSHTPRTPTMFTYA